MAHRGRSERALGVLLLAACMTMQGVGRAADHVPSMPAAEHYALAVSDSPDRTEARPLHGATLRERAYVFVTPQRPLAPVAQVDFYLDGRPVKTELEAPYDLLGSSDDGATATPLDTLVLADGDHVIVAEVLFRDGAALRVGARFEVRNRAGAAAPVTPGDLEAGGGVGRSSSTERGRR